MKGAWFQSELLALQILPAIIMGTAFEAFRHREPSLDYTNSIVFVFLGVGWFFNRAVLTKTLERNRARVWVAALLFCLASIGVGFLTFSVYPLSWAFWPVFFAGAVAAGAFLDI